MISKERKEQCKNIFENATKYDFLNEKFLRKPEILIEQLKEYLDNHGDVNVKDKYGRSILHILACIEGYHTLLFNLIKRKADINVIDNNKQTPLHYAVKNGIFKNTAVLLNCCAYVNSIDKNGNTPLDLLSKGKVRYKLVTPKEINGNVKNVKPEVVIQYIPTGEFIHNTFGNVLDLGEKNVSWLDRGKRESSLVSKEFIYDSKKKMGDCAVKRAVEHYKLNFAKYLLSWGAMAKESTLDSFVQIIKRFQNPKKRDGRDFEFKTSSIKILGKGLSQKRLLDLKNKLNKKGISVEISKIDFSLPISDKISFLARIYFQNDFLSKEQLKYPKNQTYLKRKLNREIEQNKKKKYANELSL